EPLDQRPLDLGPGLGMAMRLGIDPPALALLVPAEAGRARDLTAGWREPQHGDADLPGTALDQVGVAAEERGDLADVVVVGVREPPALGHVAYRDDALADRGRGTVGQAAPLEPAGPELVPEPLRREVHLVNDSARDVGPDLGVGAARV